MQLGPVSFLSATMVYLTDLQLQRGWEEKKRGQEEGKSKLEKSKFLLYCFLFKQANKQICSSSNYFDAF